MTNKTKAKFDYVVTITQTMLGGLTIGPTLSSANVPRE